MDRRRPKRLCTAFKKRRNVEIPKGKNVQRLLARNESRHSTGLGDSWCKSRPK